MRTTSTEATINVYLQGRGHARTSFFGIGRFTALFGLFVDVAIKVDRAGIQEVLNHDSPAPTDVKFGVAS
jgi:hypothetical protein